MKTRSKKNQDLFFKLFICAISVTSILTLSWSLSGIRDIILPAKAANLSSLSGQSLGSQASAPANVIQVCDGTIDVDGNGKVSIIDFMWLVVHFGQTVSRGVRQGDLNCDGRVSIIDYVTWINVNYAASLGKSSPIITVTPTRTPPQTTMPTQSAVLPTVQPSAAGGVIWTTAAQLATKPMSGPAWDSLKSAADGSLSPPELYNQDSHHPQQTLAVALVYARTRYQRYQAKARDALLSIIVTGPVSGGAQDGRSLALGRNLAAYVVSADLIDLAHFDSSADQKFRTFLINVRFWKNSEGRSLVTCHEIRPNNWGAMCGASRIAADMYLSDKTDLARAALVFKGFLGDRASYVGFQFQSGALTWMCDSTNPRPINPAGCVKDGHDLSGAQVDDVQRGGSYVWPPNATNYAWGGFSATVAQAELLHRAGYDAFNWENQAIRRGMNFLETAMKSSSGNPTDWMPWVVNYRYATNFQVKTPTGWGRLMGWSDWTHAR